MSLFSNIVPPRLPTPPLAYDDIFMAEYNRVLYLFFQNISAVQPINITSLNINVARLPTEASLSTLRSGDVYRDTSAGNVLKIKP
jgi:hypothetical protein